MMTQLLRTFAAALASVGPGLANRGAVALRDKSHKELCVQLVREHPRHSQQKRRPAFQARCAVATNSSTKTVSCFQRLGALSNVHSVSTGR